MWSLELFRVVDGTRLGELPLVPFSWDRKVRDGRMAEPPQGAGQQSLSSFSFTMPALESAGWISRNDSHWQQRLLAMFMPKRHGIMALWDGTPIVGGPIADPVTIDATKIAVTVDGITKLLETRFVVPESFSARRQVTFKNLSLGTIAKRVVQQAMAKPAGALPITFQDDEKAGNERNYQAFNVANLAASQLLDNLSNVINGPDIDFRPYIRGPQHFAFHMHTGSKSSPWIGQSTLHDFEVGSTDVSELTATYSTAYTAHRVYGVGGNSDVSTVTVRVGVDDTAGVEVPKDFPLVERVHSDSQVLKPDLLKRQAEGRLLTHPIVQPTLSVRADGTTPLGRFWPGDMCRVTVHDSPVFADGTYEWRILGMSGDAGKTVKLDFDPVEVTKW